MVCCNVFYWVGMATIAYFAAKLAMFANQYFLLRPSMGKYKKAGSWAVVTGGGDGIGKAMVLELATRGFDVCLIGRTKSKLDDVAEQAVQKKPGTKTKTIAFDFSKADDAAYAVLAKELKTIEVGILVNNVGINYEYPMTMLEDNEALDLSMIKVNCDSQIRMTRMVLPNMKEKRAGAIVNLSSLSCRINTPMLSVYAATKAFNKTFSEATSVELKEFGIDVMCVSPSMVCSNMSGRKRPAFDCPSAKAMAWNTVNQLGGTSLTYGHRHHGIIGGVLESLPAAFVNNFILNTNKTVQKKAIRKKERAAAEQK